MTTSLRFTYFILLDLIQDL